jgi:hypothetical protein
LKQSPRASVPTALPLKITTGVRSTAERIVIYGTGGIGKSTLAMYLPGALWFDVENGATHLPIANAGDVTDWLTLRGMLASIEASPPKGVKSIVVDTVTVAEELAKEHVISTRSTEKGKSVDSIEGFGWGKGWQFVYEEFNGLLADLDRIWSKGINVCLIAHEVASPVPNPMGEDYIRWEPHLFSGDKKGRGSVRDRVKQWADHVLFVAYDVYAKEGKAQGSGTRTIYSAEMPTHIAKSRVSQVALPFQLENPGAVWSALGITQ